MIGNVLENILSLFDFHAHKRPNELFAQIVLIQKALGEADFQLIAYFEWQPWLIGMHHFFQAGPRIASFLEWRFDKLPDGGILSRNDGEIKEGYNLDIVVPQRYTHLIELWQIILTHIEDQTIRGPASFKRSITDHKQKD